MCILKALATPSPDKNISMYPQNRLIQRIPSNLNHSQDSLYFQESSLICGFQLTDTSFTDFFLDYPHCLLPKLLIKCNAS